MSALDTPELDDIIAFSPFQDDEVERGRAELDALKARVTELEAENAHLNSYADKLAAGWPEGMLPADVRNIRDANSKFAQQVFELEAENSEMLNALDKIMGIMIRPEYIVFHDDLPAGIIDIDTILSGLSDKLFDKLDGKAMEALK